VISFNISLAIEAFSEAYQKLITNPQPDVAEKGEPQPSINLCQSPTTSQSPSLSCFPNLARVIRVHNQVTSFRQRIKQIYTNEQTLDPTSAISPQPVVFVSPSAATNTRGNKNRHNNHNHTNHTNHTNQRNKAVSTTPAVTASSRKILSSDFPDLVSEDRRNCGSTSFQTSYSSVVRGEKETHGRSAVSS